MTRTLTHTDICKPGRTLAGVLALVCLWAVMGCNREPTHSTATQDPGLTAADRPLRIVSLSPALTDILIDLELGPFIVGRDTWEKQLDDREPMVPRVGDLSHLDAEALVALDPTDIVYQETVGGLAPKLQALAERSGWNLVSVRVDSLADVTSAVQALASALSCGASVERQCSTLARADELVKQLAHAGDPVDAQTAAYLESIGPILMLYSLDPPAAFGPGSYLDDILTNCNGTNTLTRGPAWQELNAETVLLLDPWAIVLVRQGPAGVGATDMADERLSRLDLECVRAGRVYALAHPQILLPGTSMALEVPDLVRDLLAQLAGRNEGGGG